MSGRSCKGRRCIPYGGKATVVSFTRGRRPPSASLQTMSGLALSHTSVVIDIGTEPHGSAQGNVDDRSC